MNSEEQLIERLTRFYREAGREVSSTPPVWVSSKQRTVRWLQPVLASLALVVVAVGLAVTLRIVREEAQRKVTPPPIPSASPSPSPSASATPSPTASPSGTSSWITRQVSFGPVTTMALDTSAIFALYAPAPVSGGIDPSKMRLARIDRTTGTVTTAGEFPYAKSMARVTAGLWVAAGPGLGDGTPGADVSWLTLVDPATLKVKLQVRPPAQANSGTSYGPQLTGTSDLLWLGYGQSLYRLDPATGRILLTQSLPGSVTSISIDASSRRLYAGVVPSQGTSALVIEWDASTGARIASAPTGGADLGGPTVVAAPDGVWVAYATGTMGATEHRADTTLSVLARPLVAHSNGIRAFVGGGALWLVDGGAGKVECADLRTGATAASNQENLAAAIVADANGSYLGDSDGVGFMRPPAACPH